MDDFVNEYESHSRKEPEPKSKEQIDDFKISIPDLFDKMAQKTALIPVEPIPQAKLLKQTRKPPHASDAERGVLCGLLLDSDSFEIISMEGIKSADFYIPAHAIIFEAMSRLHEGNIPINTVTVVDELIKMQKLEQVGGAAYVAQLEALLPTSAHCTAYARLIQDKAALRKLISVATEIVQSGFRQDRKVVDVIDEAEKEIMAIRDGAAQKGVMPIAQLVNSAMDHLEAMYKNKTSVIGIPSGFKDLDRLTNGFQPGEFIVIAARPSMGKTAFTLNVAANVAMQSKQPVAFFSLEMGAEQLIQRLIGAEARIDISNLRKGHVQKHEFAMLIKAAGLLGDAPMYIDESPTLSIAEMRNKARRMVHQHDAKLIIIDYLQLMTGPQGYDNKATEVGEISKGLKSIARELKIPVIALSQLNRGVESRTDKRPMMSDLRESGAIEQDADIIAFLYREEYYLRDNTPEDKLGLAELIISKNRNGPTGTVGLRFFNHITRFVDLDKEHSEYNFG